MKPNVLTPLFEIVAYIALETDIVLNFSSNRLTDGSTLLYWYVGSAEKPTAGDMFDRIYTDDLDEDKLDRWVSELQELVDDYHIKVDGRGIPITDDQDEDELSREDNERVENLVMDRENRK